MKAKPKPCDGDCGEVRPIWCNRDGKRYCKQCAAKLPKKNKEEKPKKHYTIPNRSSKKIREDAAYSVLRANYLKNHPMCEMAIPGICIGQSTDIQHLKGRVGDNYLDDSEWMSACRACHSYSECSPAFAKEQGFAKSRLNKEENE